MWTAGQVAGRLGVAPATLRAWHRRYGVGPEAGRPGQYRRYGEEDVARLARMRELIEDGMLAADAARVVGAGGEEASAEEVLARVVQAMERLDTEECAKGVRQAIECWGVVGAWERVCLPALAGADDRRLGAADCIAGEHVLSWAVIRALHGVPRPVGAPASVVLGCPDAELHTLGLEALAAALAEKGTAVRMLGPGAPAAALAHAARVSGARVVVLWSQRRETASAAAVRAVVRCGARVLLAGPGWRRDLAGGERVGSLGAAVAALHG